MTDAETIAELRALLAERDAEIGRLRAELDERTRMAFPDTIARAYSMGMHADMIIHRLRQRAARETGE